ncbi:hypothetical protein BB560_004817 [Smittium megazygosporum]|uniref:Uncharacterized protein n=1 Tax=Smittium megazygosporum TaxID=133381 RepID=A0A2T9Z861_9FUNG|nr:hypothetical protein BB560_004817 [Smittium megazygosporum]
MNSKDSKVVATSKTGLRVCHSIIHPQLPFHEIPSAFVPETFISSNTFKSFESFGNYGSDLVHELSQPSLPELSSHTDSNSKTMENGNIDLASYKEANISEPLQENQFAYLKAIDTSLIPSKNISLGEISVISKQEVANFRENKIVSEAQKVDQVETPSHAEHTIELETEKVIDIHVPNLAKDDLDLSLNEFVNDDSNLQNLTLPENSLLETVDDAALDLPMIDMSDSDSE